MMNMESNNENKEIRVINLSYKDILKECNVTFTKGVNYLKGENGTGKSILMDCLSGINRSYKGEIQGNHNIIYLNQNLYFSSRLTCKDFVEFVFQLDGIKDYKEYWEKRITFLNQNVIMEKVWKRPIGMLSGGERAKLFFLAITCLEREWYLLDEPFAGVDTRGKDMMSEVIHILEGKKRGVIITSHEEDIIHKIEDVNVVFLNNKN